MIPEDIGRRPHFSDTLAAGFSDTHLEYQGQEAAMDEARWGFNWQSMTERCVEALVLAQREAEFLNDPVVGTEHVLIGLLSCPNVGADLLAEAGVDAHLVRATLEKFRSRGGGGDVRRFSWRVRQAVEIALEEAQGVHEDFVNTDHLFVGLLRQGDSTACRILQDLYGAVDSLLERLRGQHGRGRGSEGGLLCAEELLGQLRVVEVNVPPEEQVAAVPSPGSLGLDSFLEVLEELSKALQTAHEAVGAALLPEPGLTDPIPGLQIQVPVVDGGWPVVDEETYQIGSLVRQILSGMLLRRARRVILEPSARALRVEYHSAAGRPDVVDVPAVLRYVVPFKVMRMAQLNPMEKGRELEGGLTFRYRGRSYRMRVHSEPVLKGMRVEVTLV